MPRAPFAEKKTHTLPQALGLDGSILEAEIGALGEAGVFRAGVSESALQRCTRALQAFDKWLPGSGECVSSRRLHWTAEDGREVTTSSAHVGKSVTHTVDRVLETAVRPLGGAAAGLCARLVVRAAEPYDGEVPCVVRTNAAVMETATQFLHGSWAFEVSSVRSGTTVAEARRAGVHHHVRVRCVDPTYLAARSADHALESVVLKAANFGPMISSGEPA